MLTFYSQRFWLSKFTLFLKFFLKLNEVLSKTSLSKSYSCFFTNICFVLLLDFLCYIIKIKNIQQKKQKSSIKKPHKKVGLLINKWASEMNKLKEEEKKWEAESSEEECSVEKWKRDQIISLVLYIISHQGSESYILWATLKLLDLPTPFIDK